MSTRVFIGSSKESIAVAHSLHEALETRDGSIEPTVWPQGVFQISKTTIESLMVAIEEFDAAVFVLAPDDVTKLRGVKVPTVRDNVVFELGLFMGKLGRDRCFVVKPKDVDDLHLPTDLLGMTAARYNPNRRDKNLVAALGSASNQIVCRLGLERATDDSPQVEVLLTKRPYRLWFRPQDGGSKRMVFKQEGVIVQGSNRNESSWQVVDDKLEFLNAKGTLHSRFAYDIDGDRFVDTNEPSSRRHKGQYMVVDT